MVKPTAIISGAGLMGRWHAHYARSAGAKILAVVDPDPRRAEPLAQRFRAQSRRALQEIEPPAGSFLHIATPLSTHAELIRWGLAHRCHVLCEKPLVDTAEETASLLEAAARARAHLIPIHQFGFQTGFLKLDPAAPPWGQLTGVEFRIASRGADGRSPEEVDSFLDEVAPHPLSLLHRVLGIPIASLAWQWASPVRGEWLLTATHGTALIAITVSTRSRPPECRLDIHGDQAGFRANLFHGFSVQDSAGGGARGKIWLPFGQSLRTLARSTANLVRRTVGNEPAYPGLKELIRRTYSAAAAGAPPAIDASEILAVAQARDAWRKLRLSRVADSRG